MQSLLAILFRNLEKWRSHIGAYADDSDKKIVDTVLADIDTLLSTKHTDLCSLKAKYDRVHDIISSNLISVVKNDETTRKATQGQSSSGELNLSTKVLAVVSAFVLLQNYDLMREIKEDVKDYAITDIVQYLNTVEHSNGVFNAVLIGYIEAPEIRAKFAPDIEKEKDAVLGAKVVSFPYDHILPQFQRESAYSSEKDIAALIAGAASFNDIAPCIVLYRVVGSQYYFNADALLSSRTDPAAGLTNRFIVDHTTITALPMSSTSIARVQIYGDVNAERFHLIDTIDGVLFARLSYRGIMHIPRENILVLFGERVSREAAYHSAMEPAILDSSHNVRARSVINEYVNAATDKGTTEFAKKALQDYFREKVTRITDRASYLRVVADRKELIRVVKTAAHRNGVMTLAGSLMMERKVKQFVRKFEKNVHAFAPSDKEIDAAVNARNVFDAAFQAALDSTLKIAEKNKILAYPDMSIVEFAEK